MNIVITLNNEEAFLISKYAKLKNISISELFRQAVLERIEDDYDSQEYDKAIKEYEANPVTYSHDDVGKTLGLTE